MEYQIRIESKAKKELAKIPKIYQKKILLIIPLLAKNPFIGKKLGGGYKGAYSYRVWPYRIIYSVHRNLLLVIVIRVGHRQGVYK